MKRFIVEGKIIYADSLTDLARHIKKDKDFSWEEYECIYLQDYERYERALTGHPTLNAIWFGDKGKIFLYERIY